MLSRSASLLDHREFTRANRCNRHSCRRGRLRQRRGEYLRRTFKSTVCRRRRSRWLGRLEPAWRRRRNGRTIAATAKQHCKLAGRRGCRRLGRLARSRQFRRGRWKPASIVEPERPREFMVPAAEGTFGHQWGHRRGGRSGRRHSLVLEHRCKLAGSTGRCRRWCCRRRSDGGWLEKNPRLAAIASSLDRYRHRPPLRCLEH